MARTPKNMSDVTIGSTVTIPEMTGTVKATGTYNFTVKLEDPNGNIFYVPLPLIKLPVPFIDGQLYIDNDDEFFVFRSRTTDGPDKFQGGVKGDGPIRTFEYPSRPLRPVTVDSTELND